MTLAEIKDAYSELHGQQRGTFLVAVVLTFLSLMLFVVTALPVKAEVTSSNYQVGGGTLAPVPGAPPGQPPGNVPGFLSAAFDLKVPKKIKGQQIDIRRITFYDEGGKLLGEVAVENINRRVRVQPTASPIPGRPPPNEQLSLSLEPVEDKMHLWPLEEGIVNFNAVARRNFGVKPGQKIYAVISGKAGIRAFEVKAPTSEARGFGF